MLQNELFTQTHTDKVNPLKYLNIAKLFFHAIEFNNTGITPNTDTIKSIDFGCQCTKEEKERKKKLEKKKTELKQYQMCVMYSVSSSLFGLYVNAIGEMNKRIHR